MIARLLAALLVTSATLGAAPPETPPPAATLPLPGLIAHWTFDDDVQGFTHDTVQRMPLRLLATPRVRGIVGNGIQTDGEFTYAAIADNLLKAPFPSRSIGAAEDFSFSCWVRLSRLQQRHPILTKQGNLKRGFMLAVEPNDKLSLQFSATIDHKTDLTGKTPLKLATWHHIAVTYDFVGDRKAKAVLYLDGKQEARSDIAAGPVMGNDIPLEVGRIQWSQTYRKFLFGRFDELQVYSRALSADEVALLATPPTDAPPAETP
jgi:hypothetical protein